MHNLTLQFNCKVQKLNYALIFPLSSLKGHRSSYSGIYTETRLKESLYLPIHKYPSVLRTWDPLGDFPLIGRFLSTCRTPTRRFRITLSRCHRPSSMRVWGKEIRRFLNRSLGSWVRVPVLAFFLRGSQFYRHQQNFTRLKTLDEKTVHLLSSHLLGFIP